MYANPLDPLTPAGSDPVSQGDDRIRETKAALIERLLTAFEDVDADPMILKPYAVVGHDAAAGSDTSAVDLITRGPRSRGLGAVRAITWLVSLLAVGSGSTLQNTAEAWRLQEIANATSREVVAWNPNGPVMGGIPTDANIGFLPATRFGRFAGGIDIAGSAGAVMNGLRFNGSFASPTQALAGNTLLQFLASGWNAAGGSNSVAEIRFTARDNITSTTRGTTISFRVGQVGGSSIDTMLDVRGGGTNIGELVSGQATLRFISGATLTAFRDSTNTFDTFSVNAAGTTVLFPVATAFVVGTDPGSGSLLRVGGTMRVSTIASTSNAALVRSSNSQLLAVYGGDTDGGNAFFYGPTHATQANDIEFRSGSTVVAAWDNSLLAWLHPTVTSFVIGTDPGTTRLFRVGGSSTFSGSVNLVRGTVYTSADYYTLTDGTATGSIYLAASGTMRYNIVLSGGATAHSFYINTNLGANLEGLRVSHSATIDDTALMVGIFGTMYRVSIGAADSAGTGFRQLRVPN